MYNIIIILGDDPRSKKKKSRWGGTEHDKTFIPGMPTILPSTLDPTQQEAYLGKQKSFYYWLFSCKLKKVLLFKKIIFLK